MYKHVIYYSVIPLVLFASLYIALSADNEIDLETYATQCLELNYTVSEDIAMNIEDDNEQFLTPKLGKSFVGFKEALAFKESRGNYFVVNTLGYLGKYQFGRSTLNVLGIYNTRAFLNNPELQEKAFIANAERNKWVLRRDIKQFVGRTIDGVLVTESGILAAAHLAGPGSVKKYLRSYGAIGFTDAYGTTLRYYLKRFSGYDTTDIVGDKKAKISLL
ncbi:peptidoglycan-binding protein LysM [Flavobacteriaceae bacterium AU392]|nr:peptidoglycan-binding protein LysM [Flavobacteriaceae bacterium]RKM86124.1 peptidoglycan-binding protein LysM [Flavobacteriaceae bacterium AU392]